MTHFNSIKMSQIQSKNETNRVSKDNTHKGDKRVEDFEPWIK